MKRTTKTFIATSLAALLSSTVMAGVSTLKDMKDGSAVSINGLVDSVQNERTFTLRDKTGTIRIDIAANQSVVLKPGDSVSVNGVLNKGIFSTDVEANNITVNKDVARAVGDAIEAHTGTSLNGATAYNIAALPKEGLVKVSGTVVGVSSEKQFTLKDSTGTISVAVESNETAALAKGAQVTVIGYVGNGLLAKNINASKVLVVADSSTAR